MRIANLDNRAVLVFGDTGNERSADIATNSNSRFGPELTAVYQKWDEFRSWTADLEVTTLTTTAIDRTLLGPPSPTPRQVFAVGLNYDAHAAESGFTPPTHLPPVFTKYVSSFTGPDTDVVIPVGGNVDWEVELVVIIGNESTNIDEADGWSYIAGLTVGQDISERITQQRGPAAQFGLGKSFAGFSPQGPWLVTPDEFPDPNDLELGCTIDGEQMQKGSTRDLIMSVPRLIAALSRIATLFPGDVIFTGTPAGVGIGRTPQRFLQNGDTLDSWIEGIGQLHQRFIAQHSNAE